LTAAPSRVIAGEQDAQKDADPMNATRLAGALLAAALACAAAAPPAQATEAFPKATKAGPPPTDTDRDALADAIATPERQSINRVRDVWRHPAQSLTFWGLRPGDTVLELDPGRGYWGEILAAFAKATGGKYVGVRSRDLAGAAMPAPGTVDLVLSGREIHNYIRVGNLDQVLAASFTALRPGGVLAIEEHRADPRQMVQGASDGYVSEAVMVAAAAKAGFKLDGRSEINANPKDSKDHPFGVWTLLPDRRTSPIGQPEDPKFDRTRFDAIGESDRMTLRFRKPR
jgi:predicted methyltransferase